MKIRRPLFQSSDEREKQHDPELQDPPAAEITEKSKVGVTILWGAIVVTAMLVGWGDRTLGKIDERLGHIEENQLTIPMQQTWMLEFKNENPSLKVPPLNLPSRAQPGSILDAESPGTVAAALAHHE